MGLVCLAGVRVGRQEGRGEAQMGSWVEKGRMCQWARDLPGMMKTDQGKNHTTENILKTNEHFKLANCVVLSQSFLITGFTMCWCCLGWSDSSKGLLGRVQEWVEKNREMWPQFRQRTTARFLKQGNKMFCIRNNLVEKHRLMMEKRDWPELGPRAAVEMKDPLGASHCQKEEQNSWLPTEAGKQTGGVLTVLASLQWCCCVMNNGRRKTKEAVKQSTRLARPAACLRLVASSLQHVLLSSSCWRCRCTACGNVGPSQARDTESCIHEKKYNMEHSLYCWTPICSLLFGFFFPFVAYLSMFTHEENQPTVEATEPNQLVILYPLNIFRFLLGRDSLNLIQSQAILKIGVKIVTSLNTDRTARST